MKIYSTAPEGNQMADLEPARYFNLAIEKIQEVEEWLRSTDDAYQPLLINRRDNIPTYKVIVPYR
jgi:hypothetical protein